MYYAQPPGGSSDLFRLSTTEGGSPIASFADDGAGTFGLVVDLGPALDALLESTAAVLDYHLTAHKPPMVVDPDTGNHREILVWLNARMAGRESLRVHGLQNPLHRDAAAALMAGEAFDEKILAGLLAGRPIHPPVGDQTDGVADNGARAASRKPSDNWEAVRGTVL
jgi:hypothetical protein